MAILARNEEAVSAAVDRGVAMAGTAVDLVDPVAAAAAIEQLVGELGGLDALVNNAGKVLRSRFDELQPEQFRAVIEQNLLTAVHATMAALPHLRQSGGGTLVQISSISGTHPLPGGSAYAAAKHALVGWSRSIFHELRDEGIRVSLVHPGSIAAEGASGVDAEELSRVVTGILEASPATHISEVEVRPLRVPGS